MRPLFLMVVVVMIINSCWKRNDFGKHNTDPAAARQQANDLIDQTIALDQIALGASQAQICAALAAARARYQVIERRDFPPQRAAAVEATRILIKELSAQGPQPGAAGRMADARRRRRGVSVIDHGWPP